MNQWRILTLALLVLGVGLSAGCSTREVATGAASGAAAYEYSNKRAMDELERDFKAGAITQEEYDRRRKEIESRSVVY